MGRIIEGLGDRYITAEDVSTTLADGDFPGIAMTLVGQCRKGITRDPSGPRTAWFAFCSPRSADVREGTSCRLHAHFPKCRHRPDPAAWNGDLCEEPVTFRGGGAGVSCYGISSPLVAGYVIRKRNGTPSQFE